MKNRIRRWNGGRWLALLLCAVLLLGMCPSLGALAASRNGDTGALTIKLAEDVYKKLDADAVVEFTLYKIGSAVEWRLYDDFTGFGILEATNDDALRVAVEKAEKAVVGRYAGTTRKIVDGKTTFDGLSEGIYLIALTKGPDGFEASPTLTTIPVRNPKDKDELLYSYDVNVKAEYSVPTETTKPPEETTKPPEETTKPPEETTKPPEETTKPPEETTKPPEETTQPPEETTPPPEETTSTPEPTNTPEPTETPEPTPTPTPGPPVEVTVEKTWSVVGNRNSANASNALEVNKPDGIWIQLYQTTKKDGVTVETKAYGDRQFVTDRGDWSFTFSNLPSSDGMGTTYEYTAQEVGSKNGWIPITTRGSDVIHIENRWFEGREEETRTTQGEDGEERTTHGRVAEHRETGTPQMQLDDLTEEEFEEAMDFFDYGVPLWGMLMGTGDETPVWPWVCAGVGVIALILIPIIGRKRRRKGNR